MSSKNPEVKPIYIKPLHNKLQMLFKKRPDRHPKHHSEAIWASDGHRAPGHKQEEDINKEADEFIRFEHKKMALGMGGEGNKEEPFRRKQKKEDYKNILQLEDVEKEVEAFIRHEHHKFGWSKSMSMNLG